METTFKFRSSLTKCCIVLVGMLVTQGCGDAGGVNNEPVGVNSSTMHGGKSAMRKGKKLVFDSFTASLVSGSYKKLEFASLSDHDDRQVDFWHNGKPVASFSYNTSSHEMTVDAEVNAGKRKKFTGLLAALRALDEAEVSGVFGSDIDDSALGLLMKAAEHCATAPGQSIHHHKKTDNTAPKLSLMASGYWGDSGIRYLWECHRDSSNQMATAYWDDYRGNMSYYSACGPYSQGARSACLGRCGSGCPCNYWWCFNRYYVQDCLDHDVCLEANPGDEGSTPIAPNCGDEWLEAVDDFVFGSSWGW